MAKVRPPRYRRRRVRRLRERASAAFVGARAASASSLPAPPKRLGRWRRGRWKTRKRLAILVVPLMALAFVTIAALTVFAIVSILNKHGGLDGADARCRDAPASCAVLSGLLLTIVPISIAVIWVLVWRLDRVRRVYRREAQQHPDRLLDTDLATDEIVGRDDLCRVLQDDLWSAWENGESITMSGPRRRRPGAGGREGRQRTGGHERDGSQRRPVVLVGDIGIGKTAVLARLTQLLAERGAVPVAIRLRSTPGEQELDLLERARRTFLATAPVRSEAEGDKIWRRLLDNDQVVIVADGLEEALMDVEQKRETSIRRAIENVRRGGVAMIISSRPHEALGHLDVAMTTLEPISPQAAVEYILRGAQSPERERVRLIVERGDVTEAPIFMKIARDLQDIHALRRVDTRESDRLGLRVGLLDHWMKALTEGRIRPDAPVTRSDRARAIENLEALALVGLGEDSLEVRFDSMDELLGVNAKTEDKDKEVVELAKQKLRATAADCERLGLVNALPAGVRFQHSILQAYLGSKAIRRAFSGTDDSVTMRAWEQIKKSRGEPLGRELLLALDMSCVNGKDSKGEVVKRLVSWATSDDVESSMPASKAVAASAAAVAGAAALVRSERRGRRSAREIGPAVSDKIVDALRSIKGGAVRDARLRDVLQRWCADGDAGANSADRDAFLAARLLAVARLAEARQHELLWAICHTRGDYTVRLAAARALGAGGVEAFNFLATDEDWTWITQPVTNDQPRGDQKTKAKYELLFPLCGWLLPQLVVSIAQDGEEARTENRARADGATTDALVSGVDEVKKTPNEEDSVDDEDLRPDAGAQVATSVSPATAREPSPWRRRVLRSRFGVRLGVHKRRDGHQRVEERAGPSTDTKQVDDLLASWVRSTCESGRGHVGRQVALAQGFRHAANAKWLDAHTRSALSAHARQLLGDETFWYVRIAVIQALTLWLLADIADDTKGGDPEPEAEERIYQWAGSPAHPFVKQAADLCARALRTGQPANYLWIDEAETVGRFGSGRKAVRASIDGELWIPRYAGWLSLAPAAQRLVAEIVILLNLADRGRTVADRDELLAKTARDDLPPCMQTKGGRAHLHVERGLHEQKAPGTDCIAGCEFDLCPYPSLADDLSRGDLSEAFCRQQEALLKWGRAMRRPWWQKSATRKELKRFWSSLERRRRSGSSPLQ